MINRKWEKGIRQIEAFFLVFPFHRLFQDYDFWDFPDGPVAWTMYFQCK